MQKIQVIILAAGHGKRMGSELPKPLIELSGKPLLSYVLSAVENAGVSGEPIIVVGQKKEMIMEAFPGKKYVVQNEQLGTGHAVMITKEEVEEDVNEVLVLYSDQPLITPETIRKIAELRENTGAPIVMATTTVEDFEDWRAGFWNFSRIIRNESGEVVRTVEKKDATEEELSVTEVNPCYFCFEKNWLFENLPKLSKENAQGEYYLTDLVKMAFQQGLTIPSVQIDPKEALGANSLQDLELISKL